MKRHQNWSFTDSFYFSFVTFFTIGLGDLAPDPHPGLRRARGERGGGVRARSVRGMLRAGALRARRAACGRGRRCVRMDTAGLLHPAHPLGAGIYCLSLVLATFLGLGATASMINAFNSPQFKLRSALRANRLLRPFVVRIELALEASDGVLLALRLLLVGGYVVAAQQARSLRWLQPRDQTRRPIGLDHFTLSK